MKRILHYILLCIFPLLAFNACQDEDLVFEHEKPQFEIKSDAILVEVIVPRETTAAEEIYIVGDFNGGTDAIGKLEYKLTKAQNTNLKYGVYLYPSDFVNGKTLADGYYFTSLSQGDERTRDNKEVVHTENGSVGSRVNNVKVIRWAAYFQGADDWPVVPANKIMLKLTVPDITPANSTIALYGVPNNWDGSDSKWHATMLTKNRYYLLVDPENFAEGTSLADEFKLSILRSDKDWWYHEDNLDGGTEGGDGHKVENAVVGKGYDIELVNWRNSADLSTIPTEGKVIKIKQVEGDWTEIAIYGWYGDGGEGNEPFGGWPGTLLTVDSDGWYTINLPDDGRTETFNTILNNNGAGGQFNFVTDPQGGLCYEINSTAGTFTEVDCEGGGVIEKVTIKWKQTVGSWTEMSIYAWGNDSSEEIFGAWPGQVVTADENGWYSVQALKSATQHLILNNNNGGLQFDDFVVGPSADACYEVDTDAKTATAVDCPGTPSAPVTIKWRQTVGGWTDMYIYCWGDNQEPFGIWPGKQVTADADGWYSVLVPTSHATNLILNNNVNSQMDFISNPAADGCYWVEWVTNEDNKATAVDCVGGANTNGITIKWKYTGSDWTAFAIYAWGGSPTGDTFGAWPGQTVTPDASGWCSVTVPAGQSVGNVIFNNTNGGDGNQFDVNENISSDICFEITSTSYTIVSCQ